MKHTKIFFALLVLAGAVLAFGCNQANSNGGNSGGSSGGNNGSGSFTMNPQQKTAYDAAIAQVKTQAAAQEIPAQQVAQQLQTMNQQFASLNFKVVDTKAGQPIAKGTDENALKARFKAEAVSGGNNNGGNNNGGNNNGGNNNGGNNNSGNNNGGNNSGNGGSSGSFTMNQQQQQAYDAAIADVKQAAANQTISADAIAQQLTLMNMAFANLGFKVVDTKAGQPIAQGTDENALKARFKAEAVNGGNNGGNNSGSSGSFTMNQQQQMTYDAAIDAVKQQAAVQEIPANMVELQLQGMNQSFANLGFKVVDTKAGQPIAQGTDENALKARFKAEAL